MKKILSILSVISVVLLLHACSGGEKKEAPKEEFNAKEFYAKAGEKNKDAEKVAHESKGVGKFTNVEIGATLDKAMADGGSKVYDLKCSACHKLTAEKLVGPGWKDVTHRRKAEWVMNFATNTDEMINKDPAAQAMLEECMVRMPNQNLSDADARAVYEFMRKNDGVK
jgi:cytochrome c2